MIWDRRGGCWLKTVYKDRTWGCWVGSLMVRLLYPSIRNPKSVLSNPAWFEAGWSKCVSAYRRAGPVASQARNGLRCFSAPLRGERCWDCELRTSIHESPDAGSNACLPSGGLGRFGVCYWQSLPPMRLKNERQPGRACLLPKRQGSGF